MMLDNPEFIQGAAAFRGCTWNGPSRPRHTRATGKPPTQADGEGGSTLRPRSTRLAVFGVGLCWVAALTMQALGQSAVQYVQPNRDTGTAMAVVVDKTALVHTAQFLPMNDKGEIVRKGDAAQQAGSILDQIQRELIVAISGLDQLVKLNIYLAQPGLMPEVQRVLAGRFSGAAKPAVTFVVGELAHPDALVSMDAVAATSAEPAMLTKRLRSTASAGSAACAPLAVLPARSRVYVSGQASSGELASATRKTLESLDRTLLHLGVRRSNIVQLKAFLTPMREVATVEKEIEKFFRGQTVPPLVFVEWLGSTPVEIELIASASAEANLSKEPVAFVTPPGLTSSPIYSRVARVNSDKLIFVSGLYGTTANDAESQIREIFGSLRELLRKTGSDFNHLVKATYYVSDDAASTKLNQLRPSYYDPKRPPAASKAMVRGVGPADRSVTLDMIAVPRLTP